MAQWRRFLTAAGHAWGMISAKETDERRLDVGCAIMHELSQKGQPGARSGVGAADLFRSARFEEGMSDWPGGGHGHGLEETRWIQGGSVAAVTGQFCIPDASMVEA